MGHGLLRSKTETDQAALPGQDHMYPFGVIGVAPRYIPAGAVIELAGIRLGCTSTPTGIRETQAGGNRIQGHSSRGGSEIRADSGSQRLIPWWSRIAHLSVKSHPGIAPGPFLNQYISWVMCCGGASICEHNQVRSICMDCGSASICAHRRMKSRCEDCRRRQAELATAGSQLCSGARRACARAAQHVAH